MDSATAENPSLLSPDDYALMDAIAARDQSALVTLYDRYDGLVFKLAFRVLGDRALADELLLDVFWEIWQKADRYDPTRATPRSYLMMLTRSRAIDRRRRRLRNADLPRTPSAPGAPPALNRATPPPADALATVPDTATADPATGLLLDERRSTLRRALELLSPDHRAAIEMSFYDGLTQTEIAAQVNRPLGTVKGWIRRGLIQLRELLEQQSGDLTPTPESAPDRRPPRDL